jgi:hypothetical protein
VSRLDTVRDRTAKVRKRMAPRAADARETATEYADRLSPKVEAARDAARHAVAPRVEAARDAVAPRLESAKDAVAPRIESAKETLSPRLETARDRMRDDIIPKVAEVAAAALAASEPVREEAKSRGAATIAALKGEVTPKDVAKARKRGRGGRLRRVLVVLGIAGVATAAWRWWKRQSEPDWNVDEFGEAAPAPTLVETESAGTDVWSPADGAAGTTDTTSGTASSDAAGSSPGEAVSDAESTDETAEARTRH